jgi:hypothetical protein
MARVAFPLVLQSPVNGSALVGAKATITKHEVGKSLGSGAPAEIFLTETESTKVSGNEITTDNTGRWTQGEGASPAYAQYWIPEGRYDILISGSSLKSDYITRELVTTEGIAAAEATAAAGLASRFLLSPLSFTLRSTSFTAKSGEFSQTTGTLTATLPAAPSTNDIVGVWCASGTTTIETSGNYIFGGFINGSKIITLLGLQWVIFQLDYSGQWVIVSGEPKQEVGYTKQVSGVYAKEYEPSATRPSFVSLQFFCSESTLVTVSVGGVVIGESNLPIGESMYGFPCLAGEKWLVNSSTGSPTMKYSYLIR